MAYKLITALVTPFDKDNKIDKEELIKLIKDVKNQGSTGIVIGGTTGEGTNLDDEELIEIIKISSAFDDLEIIINAGTNSTHKTINNIKKLKEYKHDAFMIIVPYYNKPNQEGIYKHFKLIADTFKDEKFILYNVPSRTVVSLRKETLLKLIKECPNIIGLKHASLDFKLVEEVKKKYPEFLILSGDDKSILDVLKLKGDGVISVLSHVFGKDIKELMDDYSKGIENDLLNEYIKYLSDIIFCETNPISIKYLLLKKGYHSMNLRLPLTILDKDKQEIINQIIDL